MTEAELLFTEVFGCDRIWLCEKRQQRLDKDTASKIASAFKRRLTAEPIQYILGKTEFFGLEFKVSPDVLIPRPDTEILVETMIRYTKSQSQVNILDVGTGSGCIAVSLAKSIPCASVIAVDISENALAIARHNALCHKVAIHFLQSDCFNNPELAAQQFDFIVSNPPYIASHIIDTLEPEIQHEPRSALDGGRDGFDFYRRLIPESAAYVKEGGYLIMEIGFGQEGAIKKLFQKSGDFEIIELVQDYNHINRVVVAKRIG